MKYSQEQLAPHLHISVSSDHKFGTDAFLLSDFAHIRRKDVACDFCTGCGIVALLWYRDDNHPKKSYCIDIQEKAIDQLNETIEQNNLQDNVVPFLGDLKNIKTLLGNEFIDVVTCNPPYKKVDSGILSDLTSEQIARHEVLCTIRDVCKNANDILKFGGKLCICQRPERLADVLEAMRQAGIEPKRLRFVHKNADNAPWLFLVEGKKGAMPYLQIEKPLIMQDEHGHSEEILRIYKKL